jgi:hypothetical protein
MATRAISIDDAKTGESTEALYEHPFIVRFCHWANAVALFVMVGSGLQIFRAFPSFGTKIPQKDLLNWPKSLAIGGWLGGALQWHLTFMWIYIGSGLVYLGYQLFSGNYKQILFVPADIPGVWPMVRHYFFFGPKPSSPASPSGSQCSFPGSHGSWEDSITPACGISPSCGPCLLSSSDTWSWSSCTAGIILSLCLRAGRRIRTICRSSLC